MNLVFLCAKMLKKVTAHRSQHTVSAVTRVYPKSKLDSCYVTHKINQGNVRTFRGCMNKDPFLKLHTLLVSQKMAMTK